MNDEPEDIENELDETAEPAIEEVVAPIIVVADGIRWLGPRAPKRPGEVLEFGVKSPLYTVTATFKSSPADGGWTNEGSGTLKVPLGKKGQAGFVSTWVDSAKVFASYRENGPSPVEWRRTPAGLEIFKPEREAFVVATDEQINGLGAPILTAADLLLVVNDSWSEISGLAGAIFAVGSKLFALLLERKTPLEMEARFMPVNLGAETIDALFARLVWIEARVAVVTWDSNRQTISGLSARVPMLGQLRISLV